MHGQKKKWSRRDSDKNGKECEMGVHEEQRGKRYGRTMAKK